MTFTGVADIDFQEAVDYTDPSQCWFISRRTNPALTLFEFTNRFERLKILDTQDKAIARVRASIDVIRSGGMVIMVDDEDRENEGDLVFAAEHATAEKVNFMAKEARGLICLPLAPELISKLKLPLMDDATKGPGDHTTAFTVSIEARYGVTTGISAADRAHTIRVAAAADAKPEDLVVPGHIFPLRARPGGVLERSGHTEGSVDLSKLAGCRPAAVICEIMNDDGSMARMNDLQAFSEKHGIPIVSIEDLISYRLFQDSLVKLVEEGVYERQGRTYQAFLFESVIDSANHLVITKNRDAFATQTVDVRVHRQRPLQDVFASVDSSSSIEQGFKILESSDAAALIYLCQNKFDSLASDFRHVVRHEQSDDQTLHHSQMDQRQLGVGAQILRALGIQKMRIHVSSKRNLVGLAGFGLEVVENVLMQH